MLVASGGALPSTQDAEQRIRHIREHGPTEHAFSLRTRFPAPVHAH